MLLRNRNESTPRGPRRARGTAALLAAACLALAGCGLVGGGGEKVEVLAGGGEQTSPVGRAGDARLEARRLVDMAVAADGTVQVLAQTGGGPALWTVSPRGELRRTTVSGLDGEATQMAVDPAGTVYLTLDQKNGVWRVGADGAAERVVGSGRQGFSPDGTPAAQAATGLITAVAAGGRGELYFTEMSTEEGPGRALPTLVREVTADNRLRTLMGTRRIPADEAQRLQAVDRGFRPVPGTPGTQVLLYDASQRALAAGGDGSVYVTTRFGVLRWRDGAVEPVIAPRPEAGNQVAAKPFESEGRASDVDLDLSSSDTPDLAVDAAGNLYLAQPTRRQAPKGFRWTGDLGHAGALVGRLFRQESHYRVRRVTPGGEVSTVAWAAGEVAAAGDRLYLAAAASDGQALIARVEQH